jgi:flagellar FliL protein
MTTPTTRIANTKLGGKVSAAPDATKADPKDKKKKKKKKSKKKLIIIILVVVLVGGVGYFMMGKKAPKSGPPVKGAVVSMDATTLNLADGHFLKLKLGLQTIEGKVTVASDGASSLDTSEAADIAVSEFTNRSVASLSTDEARARVKADLLRKLEKAYPDKLMGVYFVEFVMQ